MVGGTDQKISVGLHNQPLCREHGTLLHEIGHTIGFWHEQARPDRDRYVRVIRENIVAGRLREFLKYDTEVNSLGVEYDYSSIMHYSGRVCTET